VVSLMIGRAADEVKSSSWPGCEDNFSAASSDHPQSKNRAIRDRYKG
jgi:hypothetical protein